MRKEQNESQNQGVSKKNLVNFSQTSTLYQVYLPLFSLIYLLLNIAVFLTLSLNLYKYPIFGSYQLYDLIFPSFLLTHLWQLKALDKISIIKWQNC